MSEKITEIALAMAVEAAKKVVAAGERTTPMRFAVRVMQQVREAGFGTALEGFWFRVLTEAADRGLLDDNFRPLPDSTIEERAEFNHEARKTMDDGRILRERDTQAELDEGTVDLFPQFGPTFEEHAEARAATIERGYGPTPDVFISEALVSGDSTLHVGPAYLSHAVNQGEWMDVVDARLMETRERQKRQGPTT